MIQLKTNIMCGSCIAKVTPSLDEVAGKSNWKVDIVNPKKILSVQNENVKEEEIIKAIEAAGYKAEKV